MMLRKIKIWSDVPFPFLNPACSFFSSFSSALRIISIKMFPSILLGTASNVIPVQLEHFDRSPFFGTIDSIPLDHSPGVSSIQILSNSFINHFVETSMSAFRISPVMLSIPGALLFFTFLSIDLISSSDISLHPFKGFFISHSSALYSCRSDRRLTV